MNKLFKIFLIFTLIITCFSIKSNNIYSDDDIIVYPFEILHEGDIVYDGTQERIELQTTCQGSFTIGLEVDGEDPGYGYSYDLDSKKLTLGEDLLRTLKQGTSTLTFTNYFGYDTSTDYYSVDFDVISTTLTRYNAELAIRDTNHPIYYSLIDQTNSDIDGLKVIKPSQDGGTFIIQLEKDVELTSLNEECIVTQKKCSVQIIGPHTLTINYDHGEQEYCYSPAINSSRDFILGEKDADYTTNLVINDPFVLNNKDKSSVLYAYSFGVWVNHQIKVYNSKITANIMCDLLNSREGLEVVNSTIEHNTFANCTMQEGTYCYATTITNSNGITLIDNSTIKTKVIENDSYANVPMSCIYGGEESFGGEEKYSILHIKDSIIEYNPIPLHTDDCYSYFIEADANLLIENSTLNANNTTYGIYSWAPTEIKNSDVQIDAYKGNIITKDSLTLTYNDEKEHKFDLTTTNQEEINVQERNYPSVYIFNMNEEYEIIPASTDSLVVNLPNNAELTSDGKKINLDEIFKYKTISFITKEEEEDKPEHKDHSKTDNQSYIIPKTGIR